MHAIRSVPAFGTVAALQVPGLSFLAGPPEIV
jgi:hypothetical protein